MVQDIIITLQNLLDEIASFGERIKKYKSIVHHKKFKKSNFGTTNLDVDLSEGLLAKM